MQMPPIERFRRDPDSEYGPSWYADPDDAVFRLTVPEDEPVWEDGGWKPRPHEPSYRMVPGVAPHVDSLREKALAFLDRIVDFEKLRLPGEPYVIGLHCDARQEQVAVELTWTEDRYGIFAVWFHWNPRDPVPRRMSFSIH